MTDSEFDDRGQQFLIQLFEQTKGDVAVQVSMFDIGDLLGMDRETASSVAQQLMGQQLVEIRTLSGGIGISADGSARMQSLLGRAASDTSEPAKLGDEPVLTTGGRQAVDGGRAGSRGETGRIHRSARTFRRRSMHQRKLRPGLLAGKREGFSHSGPAHRTALRLESFRYGRRAGRADRRRAGNGAIRARQGRAYPCREARRRGGACHQRRGRRACRAQEQRLREAARKAVNPLITSRGGLQFVLTARPCANRIKVYGRYAGK